MAVGTQFYWGEGNEVHEIVGVVAGTKNLTIGEEEKPQLYQPLTRIVNDRPRIQFVVRSTVPPATQLAPMRDALRQVEPAAAVEVSTLFSSIGLAFLPSQIGAVLMGSIGVLGLVLASVGLCGMMAYSVARRTREIGIRMAIGASRRTIGRMVLADCARLLAAGCVPGLLIAFFVTRPLAMFLVPGLSPSDPVSFTLVIAVLTATAVLAALGPLRRALAIDPAQCLRYE
jgi:predicted lysophospholipase L1 biosynthesis ABC-type transport system permease subunit